MPPIGYLTYFPRLAANLLGRSRFIDNAGMAGYEAFLGGSPRDALDMFSAVGPTVVAFIAVLLVLRPIRN